MGWFDEQIRTRKQRDDDLFSDAFVNMASSVMGDKLRAAMSDERAQTLNAIDQVLRYYHVKKRELPEQITDRNEQLEYLMRPSGIMRRYVELGKGWYKDAFGAMLAVRMDDGSLTPLIPSGSFGYQYLDCQTGAWIKVSAANEHLFTGEAIAFYKPFPLKKLNIADLLMYAAQTMSTADLAIYGLAMAAATLVGLLVPKLHNLVFSDSMLQGNMRLFFAAAVFLISVSISQLMINGVVHLIKSRIDTKMQSSVQAAVMMRILTLPAAFFRHYGSGEMSTRAYSINTLCTSLVDAVLSTGLTSVFSLAYVTQILRYAPALVGPALLILLCTISFSVLSTLLQMRQTKKLMELSAQEGGMSFGIISGIQKIRLSGSEKRVFARWANLYAQSARLQYNPAFLTKYSSVISAAISAVGTIVMYAAAFSSGISVADYYAFNSAYGMVSGAFMSLAGITLTLAQIKPIVDLVKPVLECVPEISGDKEVLTRISGGIELNNVTFSYQEGQRPIVDNLSVKIRPGQYVAIVGKTGCGKSTLMRLLLGFETPQKGAIYYDGKDISRIDMKSLRRRIGVVTQDGKLFSGDIFSNITISAPWLTLDDAWEAAEMAGIADDIRNMPMGMHTIISEGSGGISGGQRQRLMIARAIAPKPKLLMFDEATSALDNITQRKVSESLDHMKCTRIVIAHRLSTIRQCDRILVLDQGQIIEDGKYEELIAQNGFFAELVARQQLDT